MCRLLGIKNFNYSKHAELAASFIKLAETGKALKGEAPGHKDGWGIGYYSEGKAVVRKSGRSATEEMAKITSLLKKISTTPVLILHLRNSAWKGASNSRHAHPFERNNIIFAHNGTILNYKNFLDAIGLADFGGLDTEAFLEYIIFQQRNERSLKNAFLKTVKAIKKNNRYSSLNCVFSEGKRLYAYREYSKQPEYYSLYCARQDKSSFICSEPIAPLAEWTPLKKNELIVT